MSGKARVYFIEIGEAEREKIQPGGMGMIDWSHPIGKAYFAAKRGDFATPEARAMLKLAAIFDYAKDAETVWVSLQNIDTAWTDNIPPQEAAPRSMDVGDLILWANGSCERCADLGFEPIAKPEGLGE